SLFGRLLRQKRTLHYANVMDDPELSQGRTGLGGPRALLVAPLMNKDEVIGAIVLRQSHQKPFSARQIEAIEVFADQAVIAISNVSLFDEVQARTRELSQSLDDLRAAQDRLCRRRNSPRSANSRRELRTRSRTRLISSTISRRFRSS